MKFQLSSGCAVLALLLAESASGAETSLRHEGLKGLKRLVPAPKPHHETGEPQHDEVFYKEDYPHDHQPKVSPYLKFPQPYPEVQDEDSFDADYPRDENSDGGEWAAQMDYDNAKNLLHARRVAAAKALKIRDRIAKELEDLKEFSKRNGDYGGEADKHYAQTKRALERAQDEVDRLVNHHGAGHKDDPELDEAVDAVAKAAEHLDGCEEELERAQEQVRKLLVGATPEEQQRLQEALAKSKEARGGHGSLNATVTYNNRFEFGRQRAEDQVREEQESYDEAHKRYLRAVAEREAAEEETKKAADNLRKFRKVPEHVDDLVKKELDALDDENDEEHHHHLHTSDEHSGAARSSSIVAAGLVALVAFVRA